MSRRNSGVVNHSADSDLAGRVSSLETWAEQTSTALQRVADMMERNNANVTSEIRQLSQVVSSNRAEVEAATSRRFEQLGRDLMASQKPNWGWIIAAAGACLSILVAIGAAWREPLVARMDAIEAVRASDSEVYRQHYHQYSDFRDMLGRLDERTSHLVRRPEGQK